MKRILVIEDDAELLLGLRDNLEAEGYEVSTARNGKAGVDETIRGRPDGVILDIMLPQMNGFEVCRELRKRGIRVPILMLTARSQESDKVLGLELGADDYVTKPFSINEVLARIRSMIRRAAGMPLDEEVYRFADVELDFRCLRARKGTGTIALSSLEFATMQYLIAHRGTAVSREQLLSDVWGNRAFQTTRSVDNLIGRLRQKIEAVPHEPRHLITVHGTGYRFVD